MKTWKGRQPGYSAAHKWIVRHAGSPQSCSNCHDNNKERRYHWANLSGLYKREESDWVRLCVPCHYSLDRGGELQSREANTCIRNHEMTKDNTYRSPKGTSECRTCRRDRHAKYNPLYQQRRMEAI